MKFPSATRKDHEKFCTTEGWTKRKTATGKTGTHHVNYEFALPTGDILWTRISHPVDRTDYGAELWAAILRDQLQVDAPTFWQCVRNGVKPNRGRVVELRGEPIPLGVVGTLVGHFGLAEAEVMKLTKAEAIARLSQLYAERG